MANVTITLDQIACVVPEDKLPDGDEFFLKYAFVPHKKVPEDADWKLTDKYQMTAQQVLGNINATLVDQAVGNGQTYDLHLQAWDEDAGDQAKQVADAMGNAPPLTGHPAIDGIVAILWGVIRLITGLASKDADDKLGEGVFPITPQCVFRVEGDRGVWSSAHGPAKIPLVLKADKHGSQYFVTSLVSIDCSNG